MVADEGEIWHSWNLDLAFPVEIFLSWNLHAIHARLHGLNGLAVSVLGWLNTSVEYSFLKLELHQ